MLDSLSFGVKLPYFVNSRCHCDINSKWPHWNTFYLKHLTICLLFTHTHSHWWQWATMRGAALTIRSSLGFSVLSKDSLTCGQEESGTGPPCDYWATAAPYDIPIGQSLPFSSDLPAVDDLGGGGHRPKVAHASSTSSPKWGGRERGETSASQTAHCCHVTHVTHMTHGAHGAKRTEAWDEQVRESLL